MLLCEIRELIDKRVKSIIDTEKIPFSNMSSDRVQVTVLTGRLKFDVDFSIDINEPGVKKSLDKLIINRILNGLEPILELYEKLDEKLDKELEEKE